MPILSGVVQGSCFGPLLFIVFINDISDLFSGDTCVKLFADDVKLYSKVCTNPDSLQEGLKPASWEVRIALLLSKLFSCIGVIVLIEFQQTCPSIYRTADIFNGVFVRYSSSSCKNGK